ncbi:membrane protein insertion efficiency factor YidD [Caminibacter sp.]
MILKKLAVKLIKGYKYISPFFGNNCRYYPSCSTYALWEFENDNFFKAFFKSSLRILRCNQLFRGGIDYPVIKKKINPVYGKKIKVNYWYIPKSENRFIVIKAENE